MALKKFSSPNWSQRLIADAVGLQGLKIAVILDEDNKLAVMDLASRNEYIISKKDGSVVTTPPQRKINCGTPTVQSQGTAC